MCLFANSVALIETTSVRSETGHGGVRAAATVRPCCTYFPIAFFPTPIVIFFGFCSAGFGIRSSSTPSW